MRKQTLIALYLGAILPGFAQSGPMSQPEQIKDPRAILAAAAPYYDFNDPTLKPFHLKASYQLYDDKGKPTEQGTFEYWWAAPTVYRATWSRAGATHTDWYTPDGKHSYLTTGEGLNFFEYRLQSALVSPLSDAGDLDPTKFRLQRQDEKLSGQVKFPCIEVIPIMPQHGQIQTVPLGLFPTYCFDPNIPALRVDYSFGALAFNFNHIAKFQNHFLAYEPSFFEGNRQILTAKVEVIDPIASSDPALTPTPEAITTNSSPVSVKSDVAVGWLVKKVPPVYPQDAKDARVSGKVVLTAVIGTDGRIHDLHVQEAPWPSLVASSLFAVSQWQYKPYLLNGQPVEVQTTINVIYSIGQ